VTSSSDKTEEGGFIKRKGVYYEQLMGLTRGTSSGSDSTRRSAALAGGIVPG